MTKKPNKLLIEVVNKIEQAVFRPDVTKCPRCNERALGFLQKNVCGFCAYVKNN